MKVAIHQPNYIPWVGYFYKMLKADCFVLFDNAQYPKGTSCNRNAIKTSSGAKLLTVPVRISKGHLQKINEIEPIMEEKWAIRHWKTIQMNYARSQFFKHYESSFAEIYTQKSWRSLAELNEKLITIIRDSLGIKTPLVRASELSMKDEANNLNICKALRATIYLSGDGSKGYLNEDEFSREGIRVEYSNFKHPASYPQLFEGFIPNLSAIDLLFNCGPASKDIIESN